MSQSMRNDKNRAYITALRRGGVSAITSALSPQQLTHTYFYATKHFIITGKKVIRAERKRVGNMDKIVVTFPFSPSPTLQ